MLHHKPIFPDIIFHLASRVTWQLQTNALRSVSASLWHWQAVRDSNTTERIFLPCFHYIIQPIQGGEGGGHTAGGSCSTICFPLTVHASLLCRFLLILSGEEAVFQDKTPYCVKHICNCTAVSCSLMLRTGRGGEKIHQVRIPDHSGKPDCPKD